jgi:hypothetical protein
MAISKKERSLSIWIGIAIGVAISSMLVRYALQKKAQQTMDRPGHYKSLKCGADGSPFHPIPETIRGKIPHGIVVHYEDNQTILIQGSKHFLRSWVIESSGSFRSERLFIHAQEYCQNKSFEGVNQYLSIGHLNYTSYLKQVPYPVHSKMKLILNNTKLLGKIRRRANGLSK